MQVSQDNTKRQGRAGSKQRNQQTNAGNQPRNQINVNILNQNPLQAYGIQPLSAVQNEIQIQDQSIGVNTSQVISDLNFSKNNLLENDQFNLMKQNMNQDETASFEEEVFGYKQIFNEAKVSVPDQEADVLQEGSQLLNKDKLLGSRASFYPDKDANLIIDSDSDDEQYDDPKNSNLRQRDTFSKSKIKNLQTIVHKKREYQSRRNKNYDDSDSQGDEDKGDGQDNSGVLKYKDTAGNSIETKPNSRMVQFRHMFTNLLEQQHVVTLYPIVSMIITYDSTRAVTVSKKDDQTFFVKMYDLNTYKQTFEEMIGGNENDYIKLKEVEQNSAGDFYAIVYINDGVFKLRTFGKTTRDEWEIEKNEVDINKELGLNDFTMPITEFNDPFINCVFISDDKLFIVLFHNHSRYHYHFIWDLEHKKIWTPPKSLEIENFFKHQIDCGILNFPYKTFYNAENNEVYSFYRNGYSFVIQCDQPWEFRTQQITERDLGQMVMFASRALIARSSNKILFFKQKWDPMLEKAQWVLYHSIKTRGFIYYIKGNIRIQVTTNELVFFYLIDKETFMPKLENVMYNYMKCSQMMFGSRVRYGITYKTNQTSFDVYRRKYQHNIQTVVNHNNFEGCKGLEILTSNIFLVSKLDKVLIFDIDTFKEVGQIPITLLKTETREQNEIIGLQKSQDDNFLAIISGKNLVMNEQKQNQLFIFKRKRTKNFDDYDNFALHKRIIIKDIPYFQKVSMKYYFKNTKSSFPEEIIFAKQEEIFVFNFETEVCTCLYKFKDPMSDQPQFFTATPDQKIFMIASYQDAIYYNHKTGEELDIDKEYDIDCIKEIVLDEEDQLFYFLANKQNGMIGFYLIQFNQSDPKDYKFLTLWRHKLDIGDANIFILRGNDSSIAAQGKRGQYKELVVGYKTIYINTYNISVTDLSTSGEKRKNTTLLRYECNQLWESVISGTVMSANKEYVTFAKDGMKVIQLGELQKKTYKDNLGQPLMIHSVDQYGFFKVDSLNFLLFQWQDPTNRLISVVQEWQQTSESGEISTNYDTIYNIRIHEITLRELLILQSFYVCESLYDIIDLVKKQPDPRLFYKSFLELDGANMVTLLAFDSKCMKSLLNSGNAQYFDEKYPIIYKVKMNKKKGKKVYYTTAIDYALKNNQISAVNTIIEYIVNYQNNFISSFLFTKNLNLLIQKDIPITKILASNIFNYNFDFDGWPGAHTNTEQCLMPYNESIFVLRDHYMTVFHDIGYDVEKKVKHGEKDTRGFRKIKYNLNLLPSISEFVLNDPESGKSIQRKGISTISIVKQTKELTIFDTEAMQQLIEFKWLMYASRPHIMTFLMMSLYSLILILYVNFVYIVHDSPARQPLELILLIALIYPMCINVLKIYQYGPKNYISSSENYIDLFFNVNALLNFILQTQLTPSHLACKLSIMSLVLVNLLRLFSIMRIFQSITPIVIMLSKVIVDLQNFLAFFVIIIFMFSLVMGVLGVGNVKVEGKFKEKYGKCDLDYPYDKCGSSMPGIEYNHLGLFIGNLFQVLRLSIGDFSIVTLVNFLPMSQVIIFWVTWYAVVLINCVIFLNVIVAEASSSYQKVVDTLDQVILQEKAALITESDMMKINSLKNEKTFPKYIIARQIED